MSHILHDEERQEAELGAPIRVKIQRFDPEHDARPYFQEYLVPYRHRMSVFTLLREIYERQDATLAFRNQQCGRGLCGTCECRVAGKPVKGCRIVLEPGAELVLTPYAEGKVVRDLVVEL